MHSHIFSKSWMKFTGRTDSVFEMKMNFSVVLESHASEISLYQIKPEQTNPTTEMSMNEYYQDLLLMKMIFTWFSYFGDKPDPRCVTLQDLLWTSLMRRINWSIITAEHSPFPPTPVHLRQTSASSTSSWNNNRNTHELIRKSSLVFLYWAEKAENTIADLIFIFAISLVLWQY